MHGKATRIPCELLEAVSRIVRPVRGGEPGYGIVHVMKALRLASRRPVGRPLLQRELGIGESSVKTLIRRLLEEGLVNRGVKGGIVLSESAKRLLEDLYDNVESFEVSLWGETWEAFILKGVNPPVNLTEVYSLRDYIVERGCRVAVVGGYSGGKVSFPGVTAREHQDIADAISGSVKSLSLPSLILLTPGQCREKALEAVISLLSDLCSRDWKRE